MNSRKLLILKSGRNSLGSCQKKKLLVSEQMQWRTAVKFHRKWGNLTVKNDGVLLG
jgi:hypothetical protein